MDIKSRSRSRKDWPVRAYRLGSEPGDNLAHTTTPEERLRMMWPLAVEGWRLSGREIPIYGRGEIPAKYFGPGETPS